MLRPLKAGAFALAALLASLSSAGAAWAQQDEPEKAADGAEASDKDAKGDDASGDEAGGKKDEVPSEAPASDNDPYEKPHQAYRFIGMRFRNLIVPQFILNLFADGGRTVNVFTFGPEFSTRKDGLELDFALSYADYSMGDTLFKGKSDDDNAFEIINSSMKMVYFTTDLLYEIPLDKEKGRFSLLVGGGIGLGVVFGDLRRNQATPNDPNNINRDDVSAWRRCPGPGTQFCDDANDHYGDYREASWFNGGSKPVVFPWISLPQISFRYKPVKQLQLRADLGFSISGFYFGASAAYGL
ncbi:hypothetical protein [Chondromyces crocatus]|uniref:Secreted protein n=1 Tax=Chondromyces crocatus TaxID=52 RepID=A0A0K1EP91_CHOCO|nr:hypothetical protein [Chondromyces crocatus]AKT42629.1 uncharacterized protein CMC5_068560 [Chondromyces crocatus]